MKPDSLLPVAVLVLMIYFVTKLRDVLSKQALFASPLSRVGFAERIVQGAQLALSILLVIVVLAELWGTRTNTETHTIPRAAATDHEVSTVRYSPYLHAVYWVLTQ